MNLETFITEQLELAKTRPEKVQRVIRKGSHIPIKVIPPDNATCGSCRYGEFKGLQEVSQIRSQCTMEDFSHRWINHSLDKACNFYRAKSVAKVNAERGHQQKWMGVVYALNRFVQRKSRSGVIMTTENKKVLKEEKKVKRSIDKRERARQAVADLLGLSST